MITEESSPYFVQNEVNYLIKYLDPRKNILHFNCKAGQLSSVLFQNNFSSLILVDFEDNRNENARALDFIPLESNSKESILTIPFTNDQFDISFVTFKIDDFDQIFSYQKELLRVSYESVIFVLELSEDNLTQLDVIKKIYDIDKLFRSELSSNSLNYLKTIYSDDTSLSNNLIFFFLRILFF